MKKKNKNKSLVSQTIHMFVIQSALLGIVIVTYICVSYYTVLENMQTSSRNLLQLYGKELENKLENADMLLERLIYKNNDYDMLQSEKESERYYASIEIKKFIHICFETLPAKYLTAPDSCANIIAAGVLRL